MKSLKKFSNAKFKITYFIIGMFFIPLTCTAQLSGPYTIDPAGGPFPNFVSFQAAVDSLLSQGVDGPVVINVADGTYIEKIQIDQISGTSAVNTVTFQSQSLDSTKVVLRYQCTASTNIWTLRLNYASYVTIRKMRLQADGALYARVININGTANHNIIENCQIWAPGVTSGEADLIWSLNDQAEYNTIRNNYFLNGTRGIRMEGIDISNLSSGTHIYNNTFIDYGYHAIYLFLHDAPVIEDNSLSSGGAYGIYLGWCQNDSKVRNNNINKNSGIGIEIDRCHGNAGLKCLVANNFISVGGYKDAAIGIKTYISEHVNIYHNSVNITSTSTSTAVGGYYLDDYSPSGYSSEIDVRNNIFANTGGGPAYSIESTWAIVNSNNNNYYTTGDVLAVWDGNRTDLQALQSASGIHANSVSVNPRFHSATDLHTDTYWLDGLGDATLGITTDIDGETRSSPPDIGADEFTPTPPISAGTYKIGGTSPDYLTIKDAFDDLQVKGISGPVTFEIRDGEYNEYIGKINQIPGTSPADTIILKSESGDPEKVIIHYSTDDTERNIFQLAGVDHLTIMNLSVTTTGENTGRTLRIEDICMNINIINNIFSSANTTDALLSIEGRTDDIVIMNNSFLDGGRGIYFYGDAINYSTNTRIAGNNFSDPFTEGMNIRYHLSPNIINNTITKTGSADYAAIELHDCEKDLRVIGNTITSSMGKLGVRLNTCNATNPFNGLVANNMIQIGGNGPAYGIIVYNSRRANIYHNSVNITSTDSILGRGIYIQQENNEEINIINNIIANTGAGYALFVDDPGGITLSDYNGLYTSGTNLSSWGGSDYPDLASLTAVSLMDNHSVSVDPKFISETDLHTYQIAFLQAATPLEEVKYDIDSISRDTVNPDIGAMEFYCETPDFDIFVSTTCFGDTTTIIDNSSNITDGATYSWDFDGDFSPDYISTTPSETINFYYDASGSHTLNFIVNQIGGCEDYISVPVEVTAVPVLDISKEGAYCGNNDGQATVSVVDGTGAYLYYWSTGSTDSIAENLALGTYSVAVTDTNGCTSTGVVTIEEAIEVVITELKGSSCGKSDGIAEVQATGGVEPYKYVWSNGDTTAIDSTLAPGLHYVNVIDANDCYARGSIVIGHDGSGPQIGLEGTVDNDCFGDKTGAINIGVSGGLPPYDILWSNGSQAEDLDNLPAGIYDVLIMDSDSCPTAGSFIVQQPPKITIGSVVEEAGCMDNDGRAAVLVSGGTEPYLYSWSTGGKHPLEENLSAGIYSITVFDGNGCEAVKPIIVNNVGGPVISLASISGVTCTDSTGGSINITTSGGTPLYSWLWSPGGQTTPNISDLSIGVYEVKVTDNAGCTGFNRFEIKEEPPAVNPICLVTVDTTTGMNMVVWEKLNTTNVAYYNIYRESSLKGEYRVIGTSHVDSQSIFIDSVADPSIRSWRYRLSVVDECGNESELSDPHKTMHLTMNVGLDETVNLIWDHYEGFPFSTYKIWRYDASGGWKIIDSIPSNLTSYTDFNPPQEDLTYYIEVNHPDGCNITDKKAGTLNSSKSNRKSRLKKSSGPDSIEGLMNLISFTVYPNPGTGIFNLSLDMYRIDNVDIRIFDISGKLLMTRKFKNVPYNLETRIDLSAFAAGMYQIQLRTSNQLIHRILIKE